MFPREEISHPKPVIHPPRLVPIHVLPIYKSELEKMQKEDITGKITGPTDWVNSITHRVISRPMMEHPKSGYVWNPRDLNKNIKREHYPTKALDGLLLHGKKYFSVVDVIKG